MLTDIKELRRIHREHFQILNLNVGIAYMSLLDDIDSRVNTLVVDRSPQDIQLAGNYLFEYQRIQRFYPPQVTGDTSVDLRKIKDAETFRVEVADKEHSRNLPKFREVVFNDFCKINLDQLLSKQLFDKKVVDVLKADFYQVGYMYTLDSDNNLVIPKEQFLN